MSFAAFFVILLWLERGRPVAGVWPTVLVIRPVIQGNGEGKHFTMLFFILLSRNIHDL